MDTFISNIADVLLNAFAVLWAPACIAAFLFFVVYAPWPSNRKTFFTTTGGRADGSPNP
jgi:hypothetical protein